MHHRFLDKNTDMPHLEEAVMNANLFRGKPSYNLSRRCMNLGIHGKRGGGVYL